MEGKCMSFDYIIFEKSEKLAVITLNRPQAMNAINSQIWTEIGTAIEEFNNDPELWVAIITGAGDRSFCAGADLKEVASGGFKITSEMEKWGFAGITQHYVSKPIIAAVNGFALGGGTEIALACDLVVASEKATFGLPEVKRGIIAGAGGLLRLPKQIPLKVAMNAILTGKPLTANEAKQWGLINEVVPHDQVLEAAKELANEIIQNAPVAVRASKDIVYRSLDSTISFPPSAWEINGEYSMGVMNSQDAKEGPRAFAEKRSPVWSGK
jgi:crotonobetainyl-CoA hydratase